MKKLTIFICVFITVLWCVSCKQNKQEQESFSIINQAITVDGNTNDWHLIKAIEIDSKEHLWIGEGLPVGQWKGKKDLSISSKIAWYGQKLYFLFEVVDDTLSDFDQEFTWLNDCVEIHLDPENRGGRRIEGISESNPVESRVGKTSYGYEMHFLPSNPPRVYLDDTRGVYLTDSLQNFHFENDWEGEIVTIYTRDGYTMEIGFDIPNSEIYAGKTIGLDIGLCDDDGHGRKTLMVWSRFQGPFWISMDNFKKLRLTS